MKYKLIKIYPKSPELGTILEFGNGYGLTEDWIEQYPKEASEFWEKVVEGNYEILEKFQTLNAAKYIYGNNHFNWEYILAQDYPISKVKRLSDGQIFNLGDVIQYKIGNEWSNESNDIIVAFRTNGEKGKILIDTKKNLDWAYLSDTVRKVVTPLFITEDGVGVYEGDKAWFVDPSDTYSVCSTTISSRQTFRGRNDGDLYLFSTKKLAEKFAIDNMPQYSKVQVVAMFRKFDLEVNDFDPDVIDDEVYDEWIY